jgi:hypothetical protein
MKWDIALLCALPLLMFPLPGPDLGPVITAAWIIAAGSILTALIGGGSLLGQAYLVGRRNRGEGEPD